MKSKGHKTIEVIQRTVTYKFTEVQHLNYWKYGTNSDYTLSRDAVNVYNYMYLEDNIAYGAKY